MRHCWLYALFLVSGVSALIYELIWQRLLHLLLGVSTLAVSAVLAAFMVGLAVGAWLFGRLADRTSKPLRLYAWMEAGIAGSALLVPIAFSALAGVYVSVYAWLQLGPWGGMLLRLGTALAILLIPASLIGGTMPVMSRLALRRQDGIGPAFSLLYGVNTLGAVLGAALTGFVFLHFLGMAATLWVAVGLNGAVALSAAWASRAERGTMGSSAPSTVLQEASLSTIRPGHSDWRGWALVCAAATGAITLGLEVVWTRILGIFTSNSAYAFALMLTVVLLGIGLGSLAQRWWTRRPGDSWARLTVVQWLLAGTSLALLWSFRSPPAWLDHTSDGSSAVALFVAELALTAGALLLPAFLLGLSFPLLVSAVVRAPEHCGDGLGKIYAINTLASAAGACAVGMVFIPRLGLQMTLALLAAASLGVGIIAWFCSAWPRPVWRGLVSAAALLSLVVAWSRLPATVYRKTASASANDLLFYQEGDNGTVSVLQEPTGRKSLLVDGQPVAGTGRTIVIDQKMLAHLPLLLHKSPQRALTVGFGSGGTSHSMILHGLQVDCVEIEKAVTAAAPQFVSENQGVLSHPRFRLIVDDARSWLRVASVRYDVIVTDCTNIQYKSNSDLYTVEYFRLMQQRLASDGLAAAWAPANGIAETDLKTLLRSFQAVFPHTSVWFINTLATDFLIVVGTPAKLDIDLDQLGARMATPDIRVDLESIGLSDPYRLLYTFLATDEAVAGYTGPGPLNTDDRPILSYSTYGAGLRSTIAANLLGLAARRTDVAAYVRPGASTALMLRHYAASNEALLGHLAHQRGNEQEALRHYVLGAQLLPDDRSFRELAYSAYVHLPSAPQSER
jgi:spermidine synthase